MKILMRQTFTTIIAFVFVMGVATNLMAQQSDHEVLEGFKAEYSEAVNWIDNAVTSSDLEEISDKIDAIEADYSGYSDLLDSALFPDSFSSKMNDLRSRYNVTQQNIATIEQLNERVRELQNEIEDFRNRLASLDEDADALREQINRSEASERRLSNQVRQLRQTLQQRDQLVSEFLENLIKRYETVDAATAQDLAEAAERLDDNPLDLVKTVLGEYINYTNQATGLDAVDYMRMRTQYSYFSEVWNRIGERLSEVFAPDRPVQAEQEVTDLLANWNSSIDNRLWNALDSAFSQNNIDLPNFTSAETFFNALNTYVDNAINEARDSNREEDLENVRAFSSYWNGVVKADWGEYMMNSHVLSYSQMATIDQKMDDWTQAAVPTSNLMLILFLLSIAVIIVLIVMLVRKPKE